MFEHKCYCRFCGLEAVYSSRKAVLSEKQKKELPFTCNACMWEILQKRWQKEPSQLNLFK